MTMNPKIKSNISWQKIDNEILIMDTAYQKKAHSLNSSASFIWEHCNGSNTVNDIATLFCKNYETSLDQAIEDVNEVINQLKSLDLLENQR